MADTQSKVRAAHLARDAYLYVRQSTVRQVFENTESTKRQYALRQRAVALGWPIERVHVIDTDLGQSGASAADREGFKRLITEVSLGRVGIVLGLEVSRLARNSMDWHRLLELCALSDALILDEDGLYDPNDFNDRLLLGLKGTMSEAELHFLRARLRGGILNKARRGELALPLPVGFIYDERGQVRFDPDSQVQETIRLFFEVFRRTGSAYATVKHLREEGLLFPRRLRTGPRKGELVWAELGHSRALELLHNPRYAGVFSYGRKQTIKQIDGSSLCRIKSREEWHSFIPMAHEGYISFDDYEENRRRLKECSQSYGEDRKKSPPREGSALLQGIAICGLCGRRMTVRYRVRQEGTCPEYTCEREALQHAQPACQIVAGKNVDKAVGQLLMEKMTPVAMETAMAVQQEICDRLEETDRLRAKQVERVRYEAELAQRRYMQVDPGNRLVADVLEAEWNEKLRALEEARQELEKQRQSDRLRIDEEERARILALATDFPRIWENPNTSDRDRKRMVRLLIEDVTLTRKEEVVIQIRFKGGTVSTLIKPIPQPSYKTWETPPEIIAQINRLIDEHTDKQIASVLNQQGLHSGKGKPFSSSIIRRIRATHGLKSRLDRLRERGMLTMDEMAAKLGVRARTVRSWMEQGLLRGHAHNDHGEYLFELPAGSGPFKWQGKKLSKRQELSESIHIHAKEVQYEA